MATTIPPSPQPSESRRDWHRLFGLLLTGHLEGSPFTVELEKDLSLKQQFLDVVIVRRGQGTMLRPLPDGLDDFVDHNLITFKSYQEALNDWALKELTGHYVAYRKLVSPIGKLIPESTIGLYAICARTPRDLFKELPPEVVQPGVYRVRRGTDLIRIVVAAELPLTERNTLLHLFSAAADRVQYGQEHYPLPTPNLSSIINDLFTQYRTEGLAMPYTMNDYRKEVALEVMDQLTPEQRMAGLPPEKRVAGLPLEQRLAGLTPEEIKAYLKTMGEKSPTSKRKKSKTKK